MKIKIIYTLSILVLSLSSCMTSKSYILQTKEGIDLKLEMDYKLAEVNRLENRCEFNYMVTNLSNQKFKARYSYDSIIYGNKVKLYKQAVIEFELLTSDGKKIQVAEKLSEIEGGFSSESKRVWSTSVGMKRRCIGIEPREIVYK